jgi:hypothetical protein
MPTISPFRTPRARSARAAWSICRLSSSNVSRAPRKVIAACPGHKRAASPGKSPNRVTDADTDYSPNKTFFLFEPVAPTVFLANLY